MLRFMGSQRVGHDLSDRTDTELNEIPYSLHKVHPICPS